MRRCQRPGKGNRHAAHVPIAVGAERGRAFQRFDAALRQAQGQRGLLRSQRAAHRRSSIAARNCRCRPCRAKSAPGTSPSRCGCGSPAAPHGRSERARRRREAPAGDHGQNGRSPPRIRQDRSNQRPRVARIDGKRRRQAKAVQRRKPEQHHHQHQLDRQDEPVSGLDQRAKAFRAGRSQAQARSAPARRPPAPRRAKTGAGRQAATRSAVHAIAASGASAPTQNATPMPCRNIVGRVSHCGGAVRHVRSPPATGRRPAIATADSARADATRGAPPAQRRRGHRRHRDQQ